jgi:hypothetical protein
VAPPYTESAEAQQQPGGDAVPPPPSYDQVLNMDNVYPVTQEEIQNLNNSVDISDDVRLIDA